MSDGDGKSWTASRCFQTHRGSTILFEFTNALRRFSSWIDDVLMEVAVSRCGSTSAISGQRIDDAERFSVFADFQVSFFALVSGNFIFGVTTNVGW